MAGVKFKSNGAWQDMENTGRIKTKKNGVWNGNVARVYKKLDGRWYQMYPSVEVAATVTLTGSGLDYINTTSTNWKGSGTARQGAYGSYGQCVGWLNIRGSQIPNYQHITEITSVSVDYDRYGIGTWSQGTPLVISETTKTDKTTGGSSHYDALSRSMKSDNNMNSVGSSQGWQSGTVTFNNNKANILSWIKSNKYLVVGGSGAAYAGTRKFVMRISYKYKISYSFLSQGVGEEYSLIQEGKSMQRTPMLLSLEQIDTSRLIGAEKPTFVNSTTIYYDKDSREVRAYLDVCNVRDGDTVEISLDNELTWNVMKNVDSTLYSMVIREEEEKEYDKILLRVGEDILITINL